MVETTASTDGAAYKQGVARQLRGVTPLGPGRNRTNLWKPTIDALGQLLGTDGIRSGARATAASSSWARTAR